MRASAGVSFSGTSLKNAVPPEEPRLWELDGGTAVVGGGPSDVTSRQVAGAIVQPDADPLVEGPTEPTRSAWDVGWFGVFDAPVDGLGS